MFKYDRNETLLPEQRRFSKEILLTELTQEKHLRAERATSDAVYPGERRVVGGGGKFNVVVVRRRARGGSFQVATPRYCTPVVQSLQLLSALTVLLAEK